MQGYYPLDAAPGAAEGGLTVKQFEISCSRCGKRKRVRSENFVGTSYEWKSGGGTLICPKCSKGCSVITSRDQTIANMARELFRATEPWEGD